MKPVSILLFVALGVIGCKSADDSVKTDLPANAGQAMNPSGKPQTAEQADTASKMQKSGDAARQRMAQGAKEMEEAKQRTGGK